MPNTRENSMSENDIVIKNTPVVRAYIRVSQKHQVDGLSLDSQEKIVRDYCKQTEKEIDFIYIEKGESARIPNEKTHRDYENEIFTVKYNNTRTQFNQMVQDAKKSLFSELLIIKWDRFARKQTFQAEIKLYLESLGIEIIPIQDTNDPLAVEFTGVMNEKESDRIKERVERTMWLKVQNGLPPQGVSKGYKSIKRNGKMLKVVVDKKESEIIKEIFKLTSEGVNWKKICEKFSIGTSSYYNIIKNPFYYGKILWKGKLYDSKAEPIITKELFDKVQEKIGK